MQESEDTAVSNLLNLVSSQYKHLPGRDVDESRTVSEIIMLKNEPFSFQALYRSPEASALFPVSVAAETDLPAEAWRVDYVPIQRNAVPDDDRAGYEWDQPGLFPDLLMPRPACPEIVQRSLLHPMYLEDGTDNLLNAIPDYQAVWFTINPDSKPLEPGDYRVRVVLRALNKNTVIAEEYLTVHVIDAALPDCEPYYTNWFHVDCLSDFLGVTPYSPEFYRIFDQCAADMARHRQNTILLPAFTPPLDTITGEERMNVQLTDIEKTNSGWQFGFDRMKEFIRHARKAGIRYFEHCHLFSQWGAEHAPNIYDISGSRIFGFETDASGEEYTGFIRCYLTTFLKFAADEGISDSLLFHISDEPSENQLESYRKAHDVVADLLEGYIIADAMSSPMFPEAGLVDQPIVSIAHADHFDKIENIWLYYTGSAVRGCTNRMITNTAARTRILGLQLYRYQAVGFLHWAYNFYYDRLSIGFYNPASAPCAYKQFPGITFLAYPIHCRGGIRILPSVREKLMAEAVDDYRALMLLESLIGRDQVLALCEKELAAPIHCRTTVRGDALLRLRQKINAKIRDALQ